VDNLIVRGYAATGIMNLGDADPGMLKELAPKLVLMWGELAILEPDIENFRDAYSGSAPIIVVSQEKPAPEWMKKWEIAAHSADLSDSRHLTDFLQRWLK
jgi:hypothetical protein